MFGALTRGRFRSLASLILVVNVVGELQQKRTLAASRGFLAAARLSCLKKRSGTQFYHDWKPMWSIIDILYKISRRTIQIQGDFQDFQEL